MIKFLARHIKWIIVGVGALFFTVSQTEWLQTSALWQKVEGALIDRRYLLRAERAAHPDIKVLGLATSSFKLDALSPEEIAASEILQRMKEPWPWDRRVYAAVLEKLMNAGAKVVVFDFVFASEHDGDDVFAQALERYKDRVVIGEMFADEPDATQYHSKKLTTPAERLLLPGAQGIVGLVNMWPDPDDVVRRVKFHTSLERETPELKDLPKKRFPDNLEHATAVTAKKFTGRPIAPSDHQFHFINFQGRSGTYRPLPVENMFVESLWQAPPFNGGETFTNRIVIIGPTAEIFHDVHPTPFGVMPGPEIHAHILAAMLHGSALTETLPSVNIALALAMTALALAACLGINNALVKVVLMVVATALFMAVCQVLFVRYNLIVSMVSPLFCLIATGSYGVTFQYALEQFERRRTRSALDRLVSENVAKIILEDQRDFKERQKGRKQPVTILFSDIRGFTTLTESSVAEKLVAQLNEYFLEMGGIVRQEGGTLSKYIGDAIMAVWGDTHTMGLTEDAQRAVRAALQMRPALIKLNEDWRNNPDRQIFAVGIGVNHGEVIVGEMGHPKRTEFAVLGDGVNLAARLETATKQFHTDILIGETVEALTRDQFVYRSVGAIAFKGKTKPIETFTLVSDRSQPAPAWLAEYHEAIQLYRKRHFYQAGELFKKVLQQIGGADYLCEMYLSRCETYHTTPPPLDWNGAFTLTEK